MTGDIWDIYQQMQPGGWSPPPGIEGYPGGGWSTSGNDAWKQAQNPQPKEPNPIPNPSPNLPPNTGGQNMPRNNFPNAYPDYTPAQRQSMALAQARTNLNPQQFQTQFPNAIPQGGRKTSGYATVQSPQGGTMDVPSANLQRYLDKGYTNYAPPRTAAQQFDLNQAYAQGYGAPSPTIQQGAGGPYRVAGGVAAPYGSNFPNLQRFGSDVATLGRGIGYGARAVGNFAMNQFNNLFNRPQQQPSYANTGPRRYFDY